MEPTFLETQYSEFLLDLEPKSIYELVNILNRESSHSGWTGIRGVFINALIDTFRNRKVNIDSVSDGKSTKLRPVYYDENNNKLVKIPKR